MKNLQQLAQFFRALGDVSRLRLVDLLAREGEMCVCKIVPALGLPQSTVSHHLATLRHAGLVTQRRAGQMIFYALNDSPLLKEALKTVERIELASGTEKAPAAFSFADARQKVSSTSNAEEIVRTSDL
ncbi:MAG: hypothetical protein KatS3mg024_2061 [Armatimonadota bacterium]|nr:MAG: hypothetical protein KatS3mg024_2061 [Armatimonadota bacterium]